MLKGANRLEAQLKARQRSIRAARYSGRIDEETYRRILREFGGVDSSTKLFLAGADKVLNELNRLQGRPLVEAAPAQNNGRPNIDALPADRQPLMRKIEALVLDISVSWGYARAIAQRMHGVTRIEWCMPAQLGDVVAALTVEQDKRRCEAAVVAALSALGHTRERGEAIARALGAKKPANWNRDPELMRRMLAHLQIVANASKDVP